MKCLEKLVQNRSLMGIHFCMDSVSFKGLPNGSYLIGSCEDFLFCYIDGYQSTVFAVRFDPHNGIEVCPLAYNITELIRLVMGCGSGSAAASLGFYLLHDPYAVPALTDNDIHTSFSDMANLLELEPICDPCKYIQTVIQVIDISRISF